MNGLTASCRQLLRSDTRFRIAVGAAVAITLAIYALHVAHVLSGSKLDPGKIFLRAGLGSSYFSLSVDRSFAEWFEYMMLALVVMTFARLAVTYRQSVYVAHFFIFAFALADNAMRIHERMGTVLSEWLAFAPAFGLRAKDFGELATWALFGVPLLGFLMVALWRSDGRHRSVGLTVAGWFLALAFFGAAVDMLHSLASDKSIWYYLLGFVEDGGEMAVVVVISTLTLAAPRLSARA